MAGFLPISPEETRALGWEQVDIVCVTGDAYVDHPSFGMAIVSRELEARGYKVAVLAQPDWKSDRDFTKFGRPRLGFFVNGGNIDSMVNNYTAAKRKRRLLFPWQRGRAAARPLPYHLLQQNPGDLPGYPHRHRGIGGIFAPVCPLRLLG